MTELKSDFKDMCNTIASHYAEESTKRLDKKMEA